MALTPHQGSRRRNAAECSTRSAAASRARDIPLDKHQDHRYACGVRCTYVCQCQCFTCVCVCVQVSMSLSLCRCRPRQGTGVLSGSAARKSMASLQTKMPEEACSSRESLPAHERTHTQHARPTLLTRRRLAHQNQSLHEPLQRPVSRKPRHESRRRPARFTPENQLTARTSNGPSPPKIPDRLDTASEPPFSPESSIWRHGLPFCVEPTRKHEHGENE